MLAVQACFCSGAVLRHTNLRMESVMHSASNSSMMFAFSEGLWNNTITNMIRTEIQMPQAKASEPANKVAYVVLTMLFGICGCDRCYMGQWCLGSVKGLTFGGCMIWVFIDYWLGVMNAVTKAKEINALGYQAIWKESTIEPAFIVSIVILLFHVFFQLVQCKNVHDQRKGFDELYAESDVQPTITVRERSFALAPTFFMKKLRQAGVVTEKPTVAELMKQFKHMDKNGDGQLDHDEIKEALAAMGASDDDINQMIKDADTDGDGKVSYDEFLIKMTTSK